MILSKQDNLSLNNSEFREKKLKLKSLPVDFTVGITRRCNYDCKMCYRRVGNFPVKDIPSKIIENIFPYLFMAIICRWHCDGELFVASNFDKVFPVIQECSAEINGFSTNGFYLEEYAEQIVNSNITQLNISIDAATEETYALVRKEGAFDKVCRGVKKVSRLRKEGSPVLELMFVSMSVNIEELCDFVELTKKLGADKVTVQKFNPHVVEESVRNWAVDPLIEKRNFLRAKEIALKLNIDLNHTHESEVLNVQM